MARTASSYPRLPRRSYMLQRRLVARATPGAGRDPATRDLSGSQTACSRTARAVLDNIMHTTQRLFSHAFHPTCGYFHMCDNNRTSSMPPHWVRHCVEWISGPSSSMEMRCRRQRREPAYKARLFCYRSPRQRPDSLDRCSLCQNMNATPHRPGKTSAGTGRKYLNNGRAPLSPVRRL